MSECNVVSTGKHFYTPLRLTTPVEGVGEVVSACPCGLVIRRPVKTE